MCGLLELGWFCALKKESDGMLYNTGVSFVCSLRALDIDGRLIGFVWELALHLRLLIRTGFCCEDYLLRRPRFKRWNKANRRFTERAWFSFSFLCSITNANRSMNEIMRKTNSMGTFPMCVLVSTI